MGGEGGDKDGDADDWEQAGFDLGPDPEPPAKGKPAREPDPLGGRSGAAKASGGLDTLWRRFKEKVAAETRFRERNERSRASVCMVRREPEDSYEESEDEETTP